MEERLAPWGSQTDMLTALQRFLSSAWRNDLQYYPEEAEFNHTLDFKESAYKNLFISQIYTTPTLLKMRLRKALR